MTDKELMEIYMQGFKDELDGKVNINFTKGPKRIPYILGKMDALSGDDVSSVDLQTDEMILQRIKHIFDKHSDYNDV